MVYDTLITDSHVISPRGIVDKNIIIDDGKIVGFTHDRPACDHKINGNGLISIPGPIDTHVHYGVYSSIDQAAKTESHAAAIGGITTMMRMLRLGNSFQSSLQDQLDHSSILARIIPWTEEPDGLQSIAIAKSWTRLSD